MLEGITILNQVEIMDSPWWCIPVGALAAIVIGIIIMLILGVITEWHDASMYIGMIVAVLSMFGIWVAIGDSIPTGRYEYHVTIDESVSLKEFYSQYNIVDQQGEIYIIEDKEK